MVQKIKNKRAAMEMSVGTIVTIVLLMTVLVLGLVLIRSIFTGAEGNIKILDDKVKGEINKLFVEDKRIVVYLTNQQAEIKQGGEWGVAWAVKNLNTGTTTASKLDYVVSVEDTDTLYNNCKIREKEAMSYLKQGYQAKGIDIAPGQVSFVITRIKLPEVAPLCIIRYSITTKLDGQVYDSSFFDINIKP